MRSQQGSVSYLALSIAGLLACVLIVVIEFCHCVTVVTYVRNTIETTLEATVEYWTIDEYRQDEQLYISEEAAMDSYRERIFENLYLEENGCRLDERGSPVWRYEEVDFQCEDNGIWLSALVTVWPAMLDIRETTIEVEVKVFINYNK